MNVIERRLEAAGLKLPGMEMGDALKAGFRAVTHGIQLGKEVEIARSVEAGMSTVNAVWVLVRDEVQLWRKAGEVNVYGED